MSVLSAAKKAGRRFLQSRAAAAQGLKAVPFAEWSSELDDALKVLPQSEIFPHELFALLMKMAPPERRKIILVTERETPVAVAGLRNRWGFWEPVTQWLIPGVLFPVQDGYLERVLAALGVDLVVAWWRFEAPPPKVRGIREMQTEPTLGISFSEDYESYWRTSTHLRNVRHCGNRCKDLVLKVDPPGGLEWIIKNWDAKWRPDGPSATFDASERLFAAQYLQQKGLYHSVMLFDGEVPASGITLLIHCREAVAHMSFRNPDYDWHGAMTRNMEEIFIYGKNMGLEGLDLGGSFNYKGRWAPERGMKCKFHLLPDNLLMEEKVAHFLARIRGAQRE